MQGFALLKSLFTHKLNKEHTRNPYLNGMDLCCIFYCSIQQYLKSHHFALLWNWYYKVSLLGPEGLYRDMIVLYSNRMIWKGDQRKFFSFCSPGSSSVIHSDFESVVVSAWQNFGPAGPSREKANKPSLFHRLFFLSVGVKQ